MEAEDIMLEQETSKKMSRAMQNLIIPERNQFGGNICERREGL